jgi:4-amino-4-deoxy-L-arabinose transferase-like glycosyltransferase
MTDFVTIDTRDSVTEPIARPSPPSTRPRRLPSVVLVAVLILMTVSAVAHLSALRRDLPLHDLDEEYFVEPAVEIASTGDPNPHWFGHPGSTVIYPVAFFIRAWDVVAHDGPVFGASNELADRHEHSPTSSYLIGRLWTIALAVATLPVLFALGRRAFDTRTALVATALWAVLPYPVRLGRTIRTDSAGIFFGVLALWCCVRAWQEPRVRWWVFAGTSVGLAVSSRYFLVALLPVLVAVVVLRVWPDVRRALRAVAAASLSTVIAFAATSPFFFLDWRSAWRDISAENDASHPAWDGLSRLGNARWYLTDAIPESLTWPIYLLALCGVVLVLRRRAPVGLLLLLFSAVFLIGISLSRFHFQRWTVQLLPVLALFAALSICALSSVISARTPRTLHADVFVAVVATALLVYAPIVDLIDGTNREAAGTTRREVRNWIEEHATPGSSVVQEPDLFWVRDSTIPPVDGVVIDYDLDPSARTVEHYRSAGYDFVVTPAGANLVGAVREDPRAKDEFYTNLACTARLVAAIERSPSRGGPGFDIYRLDQPPVRVLDYFCRQPAP